jgi:beta-glucanase (GH16 family)
MKKLLVSLAIVLGASALVAPVVGFVASAETSITAPSAEKYYRIRHVSGLYLTDNGFSSTIAQKAESNTQIYQFVSAGGKDTYNIKRVNSGLLCGSDGKWSSCPLSRNVALSQYNIEVSSVNSDLVVLVNKGMTSGKNCMGVDATTDGSAVYTDKAGTDADKHQWFIEEAERYASESDNLEDKYPDHNLPADDPRANAYDGYKLVFAQEFSGEGTPDHDIWNFEKGFKRNKEDQYYNEDKNIYIQDGVCVIEGKYVLDEKIKNPSYSKYSTGWPGTIGQYLTWTSGSMKTSGSWNSGYTWLYGIYEVRAKIPQYTGCWPAIWSTGMQYEWPYGGEIDIMEYYGNCIHGNVCWGNGGRYSGSWNSNTIGNSTLGSGWGDKFHTWRMYWDYDHMEIWCDDLLVNNINLDDTYNAVPSSDFDHGNGCNPFRDVRQILWLNLALGGNNGGSLSNTPRPSYYLIDYARVYQKFGTDGLATYSVDDEISEPNFPYKDGEAGISNVLADNDEETEEISAVYNLQGMRLNATSLDELAGNHGVYLVVRGGRASKVVL